MAMLAGPKRKQKWILNPNSKNHNWAKDANKFGQKMLEKMGWTEGKGLGRKEDGMTDHIKVKCRNDQKGVGFKDSVEWSVQQDNFKTLLEELNGSGNHAGEDVKKPPQQVKSLEEASQNSRARVHYRKFTRGKDLSRYSEKQLANIFGKKKLTTEAVEVQQETYSDADDKKFGVETLTGGSMVDYFNSKRRLKVEPRGLSDSDGEQASFGFGYSSQSTNSNDCEETKFGKKFKKYKNMFVSSTSTTGSDGNLATSNQADETPKKRKNAVETDEVADTPKQKKAKLQEEPEPTKKSKKSKRKTKDEAPSGDTTLGVTNPAFEPLRKNFTIKKHTLDTITEELNQSTTPDDLRAKKKKLKSKAEALENFAENPSLLQGTLEVKLEHNPYEVQPKQKKKKSKKDDSSSFAIDNPTFSLNQNTSPEQDVTAQEYEVKRKQKKKSKGLDNESLNFSEKNNSDSNSFAIDNPSFSLNQNTSTEQDVTAEEYEVKRKRNKKTKGLDNPSLYLTDLGSTLTSLQLEESQTNDYEVKSKKKKKSKHGLDNSSLNVGESSMSLSASQSQDDLDQNQNSTDYEVKRKKKKKSKGLESSTTDVSDLSLGNSSAQAENKCLQNGIENSALEISDCDIMLNVTDEPVKTSITPKVNKRTPKNRSKSVRFSNTNQEYIINNNYTTEDVDKRNELYDINTQVIQASLKKHGSPAGLVNHGFDIKSIDQIDFCDDGSKRGIDNRAFDAKAQTVQESVDLLAKNIDQFQAEVENGINESKAMKVVREVAMVGELGHSEGDNEKHEEGLILRIKHAKFNKREAYWTARNDASATYPKKSYKHLIRGDIIVGFKNTNLHAIDGYGHKKKSRVVE